MAATGSGVEGGEGGSAKCAIVLAVAHKEFLEISIRDMLSETGILYDVKGILKEHVDARL